MKLTSEDKLGAVASYLEIEYQQKANQCDYAIVEAKRIYKPIEIFKVKKSDDDKTVIKEYILKPLVSLEDLLTFIEEWNGKMKLKFKACSDKCENSEYVESVTDILDKHIVAFEDKLESAIEVVQDYKSDVLDLLGIKTTKEETV